MLDSKSKTKPRTGDLVWAMMKGFSWWPGRIEEPDPDVEPPALAKQKPHHFCFFFGSGNYAWVEEEKMAEYDENREKLKPSEVSSNLQEAIDRIEEALAMRKRLKDNDAAPYSPMFDDDDDDSALSSTLLRPILTQRQNSNDSVSDSDLPHGDDTLLNSYSKLLQGDATSDAALDGVSAEENGEGIDSSVDMQQRDAESLNGEADSLRLSPPPSSKSTALTTESVPCGDATASSAKTKAPSEKIATPSVNSEAKSTTALLPESASPSKESASPSKESASPSKESASPSKESVSLSKKSASLSKESASPSKESAAPSKESSVHLKESAAPLKDSAVPLKESSKRKSPSDDDAKLDHTAINADFEGKAKRARKVPSKLADFAIGVSAEMRIQPPVRTFSRKSSAGSGAGAGQAGNSEHSDGTDSTLSTTTPSSAVKNSINNNLSAAKVSRNSKKLDPSVTNSTSSTSSTKPRQKAPSSLRFGFLGLGAMGSGMAASLVSAGHDVVVWNRTASKCREVVRAGASRGASAAEVVRDCDVTFSCLADPAALKEVVFGSNGALLGIADGKGYVDMSSVDVDTCREVAEAVQSRGGRFLEAPVCGSKDPARRGLLTVVAAGDKELYDQCESCFSSMAKRSFYLGDIGNAAKMKCVLNLLDGVMMAGLAEAMALTEQVGLRHADVTEVLELSGVDCALVREKSREMIEGTFTPSLALKHQQKDLKLAVDLADEHHLPLVVGSAANELFKRARAMGYDEHDNSAIYRAAQYNS